MAGDDLQEGGLPRAVGADDPVAVALGKLEVHVLEEVRSAVLQGQLGYSKHSVFLLDYIDIHNRIIITHLIKEYNCYFTKKPLNTVC